MKHLLIFLVDMGDSIKAVGAKWCTTRLSVEMSRNVTLYRAERERSLHFFFFSSFSRDSEQTRLVSLAQKAFKEHMSTGSDCEM